MYRRQIVLLTILIVLAANRLGAQTHTSAAAHHVHIIVPQSRSIALPLRPQTAQVVEVRVGVVILEQTATTTMDISLRNPGDGRIEAQLIVPVPEGAVVRGFSFEGASKEPTARLLPKSEAKSIYTGLVAKLRDPALLEFIGTNLIQSSVFPIEPRGVQNVRLTYENVLPADGPRVDYVLPRTEAVEYNVPWNVSVKIKGKSPISTVYSPSHRIETKRTSAAEMSVRIAPDAVSEPGSFRLSYLLEKKDVTASIFAYPDPKTGGGYFLMLAGLPASPKVEGAGIKREVILVLDRSGSMHGEKIRQVREAAYQVLEGLEEGETFNLIVYNEAVDVFSAEPVVKNAANVAKARKFLAAMNASGGTNIHDALVESLRGKPQKDFLPIVLFLTDGLPTIGQTSEVAIRNVAIRANPHKRRIFTFGVGVDVNTPLLQKIAMETRATSTFVLPKEDVELKVAQVFKRLSGPILAEPELKTAPARVREMIPAKLPDFFEGDQLVLLGRYLGDEPVEFELSGNYLGQTRTFRFGFDPKTATTQNAFVPRLWASRKIAVLVDGVRTLGADSSMISAAPAAADPRMKELVDEIVRLSTEFGILTEYTAFFAAEGTDLTDRDRVLGEAWRNFQNRAVMTRSGVGSVNQSLNNDSQMQQTAMNSRNAYFDANMSRVSVTAVQQINDRAFYRRGNNWVDSRIVEKESALKPDRVIEFGSEEFRKLVERLADENRQGCVSLSGDVLLLVDGKVIKVSNAGTQ